MNKMNYQPINKVGNTNLYVVEEDITQIRTDAIMTAINSGGMWFGGIDGAIERVAGNFYHRQAAKAAPLNHLQTIIAKGSRGSTNTGEFNDVLFVVDDLETSVDKVVYAGLTAATNEGYNSILLPAIRLGIMRGAVEKTPEQTVKVMMKGLNQFFKEYGTITKLEDIAFVIYRDAKVAQTISEGLKSL
jgi:O-acetyl-ADP-ribose deacetylase (regulator of RNase III)